MDPSRSLNRASGDFNDHVQIAGLSKEGAIAYEMCYPSPRVFSNLNTPETSKRFAVLRELFPKATFIDETVWKRFEISSKVNLELQDPQAFDPRIYTFAEQTKGADVTIMLVPGGLTEKKVLEFAASTVGGKPISVNIDYRIRSELKGREQPYILITRNKIVEESGHQDISKKREVVASDGFNALALVAQIAMTYKISPEEAPTLLYNDKSRMMLCTDFVNVIRGYELLLDVVVQVNEGKITIEPRPLHNTVNVVYSLALKC